MSIPCNFSPLGMVGTGILPVGYLAADFLEFTGTQYMRFPVAVNNEFGLSFDVTKVEISEVNNFPISWQRANPFSAFRISVIASYGTILWWNAGTLKHTAPASSRRLWQGNFKNSRMLRVEGDGHSEEMPITVDITANYDEVCFGKLMVLEEKTLHQPAAFKAFAIKMSQGADVVYDLVPCVNENGVPGLYDCVGKCCYQNQGTGQFIVGMNLEQARKLSKLPKTGATLTVSLPWEAQLVQHNAEVEAALEVACLHGWLLKVQYRDAEPDSEVYNKYAACTNAAAMRAVNADYMNDLTADGEWLYPLEKLKTAASVFYGAKELKVWREDLSAVTSINDGFRGSGLTEFNAEVSASNINAMLYECNDLVKIEIDAPNATTAMNAFGKSPARRIKVNLPKLQNGHLLCSGCSNLEDFDGTLPSVTDLTSAFSSSILNKESVLRIIDSLQSFTDGAVHPLYLGIHVDHQTDAEVLAAIETAETKGWSVVVRWNGTPTAQAASTFGLRRPTIYAKVVELDGLRSLDWGHYVTKWEENGYLEFASVEEAREYFNIEETEL